MNYSLQDIPKKIAIELFCQALATENLQTVSKEKREELHKWLDEAIDSYVIDKTINLIVETNRVNGLG